MAHTGRHLGARIVAGMLQLILLGAPALPQQTDYTFHAQSDLVLVNVTVRDRAGNFIRGLKPEDFTVLEDNKPQKVVSFDIENTDAVAMQARVVGQICVHEVTVITVGPVKVEPLPTKSTWKSNCSSVVPLNNSTK